MCCSPELSAPEVLIVLMLDAATIRKLTTITQKSDWPDTTLELCCLHTEASLHTINAVNT